MGFRSHCRDGVGCGKGRNDTLSVEGPLFVVPRSSLQRGVADKHFFVVACCDASSRPIFSRQRFTKIHKLSFYDKLHLRQRFRDCEDITHEPHWLRSSIHRRRPPGTRPPARRTERGWMRARVRGPRLRRRVRPPEAGRLSGSPAPERCPCRPRPRSSGPPGRRAHRIDRRT